MDLHVVTTFHHSAWPVYGKRFVDSFLRNWQATLFVFGEGQSAPDGYRGMRDLIWNDLCDDPEHEAFCIRNRGKDHPRDFNEMPVRFGHKVFAATSPKLPQTGWRVWIDADVEFTAPVEPQHLERLFPSDKMLTFLGRKGWMRRGQPAYTECGFVGYNLAHEPARNVLENMRKTFVTDDVFRQGRFNLHDSATFDRWRTWCTTPESWNDLSGHCPPQTFHVWPHSILGEFSAHHKGKRRKHQAYG